MLEAPSCYFQLPDLRNDIYEHLYIICYCLFSISRPLFDIS